MLTCTGAAPAIAAPDTAPHTAPNTRAAAEVAAEPTVSIVEHETSLFRGDETDLVIRVGAVQGAGELLVQQRVEGQWSTKKRRGFDGPGETTVTVRVTAAGPWRAVVQPDGSRTESEPVEVRLRPGKKGKIFFADSVVSPDGRLVVEPAWRGERSVLAFRRPNGKTLRTFSLGDPNFGLKQAFSANGRYLAYRYRQMFSTRTQVGLIDTRTWQRTILDRPIVRQALTPPAVSNDGTRVVFEGDTKSKYGVKTLRLWQSGKGVRAIGPVADRNRAGEPLISPDGGRVVYGYQNRGATPSSLRILNLATKKQSFHPCTDDLGHSISGSGRYVLRSCIAMDSSFQVHRISLSTGKSTTLVRWRPNRPHLTQGVRRGVVASSGDEKRLLFTFRGYYSDPYVQFHPVRTDRPKATFTYEHRLGNDTGKIIAPFVLSSARRDLRTAVSSSDVRLWRR